MQVILLEDLDGLGARGATVNVKPGYARNYLLPRKLAIQAHTRAANLYQELSRQKEIQMQKRLAEATWYLDASIMRMRADAIELGQMAEACTAAPMELRARMRWNLNRGCELVGQAVTELFHAATGRTVFLDHPLQQRFQDLQAAMAHAYLTPDQVGRAVGGSLLGTSKPEIIL